MAGVAKVAVVFSGASRMDGMSGRVLVLVLVAAVVPVWSLDLPDVENVTDPVFEEKLKQVRSKYTHPLVFILFTNF